MTAPTKAKDGRRGVDGRMLGAESVASPSGQDPYERIRENAAKELYDPDQLRGLAQARITQAMQNLDLGHYDAATDNVRLAADLLQKAQELERRGIVKEAQGV